MKQNVSPAVAVVAIVIVVAAACFFGFRAMAGSNNTTKTSQQSYASAMQDMYKRQQGAMSQRPMTGSSGMMQRMQQSSGNGR